MSLDRIATHELKKLTNEVLNSYSLITKDLLPSRAFYLDSGMLVTFNILALCYSGYYAITCDKAGYFFESVLSV